MSLFFAGSKGSVEQRPIAYAMLRDNVQHHLEGGAPTEAFPQIHRIAEAPAGRRGSVSFALPHAEMTRAKAELAERPIADLAVSLRTRSVVSLQFPSPTRSETTSTVP